MEEPKKRPGSERKGAPQPHAKLFLFSREAAGLFGDGKWRLLAAVREHGSIQEAARVLGRGYRKAWGDIKRVEEGFGRRIVRKKRGGSSGGRTELTPFGNRLLDAWARYREEVRSCMEEAYSRHLENVVETVDDSGRKHDSGNGGGRSGGGDDR